VYGPSLLDPNEDASASAAATSAGGDLTAGASSGGTTNGAGGASTSAGSATGGGGNNGSSGGMAGVGESGASGALGGKGGMSSGGVGAGGAGGAGGSAGKAGSAGSAGSAGATGSAGASGVDPCDRVNWKATASESSLSMTPPQLYNPPQDAIDGDGNTRWSSGAAQVGGEWFQIDLGAVAAHLTQIVLDTTLHPSDYPVNYTLELSSDGASYAFATSGSGSSVTTIEFADKSARFLKVTQTGTSASWWSIHEVSISCQSN
jgi:hypothetical protein